jgi:hypothetical protein
MKYVPLAPQAMMLLVGATPVALAEPAPEDISQGNVPFENQDYPLAEKLFSLAIKQETKTTFDRAISSLHAE